MGTFIRAPFYPGARSNGGNYDSLGDFLKEFIGFADKFGTEAIGYAVLRGLEPPRIDAKTFVLAFGEFEGRSYAAVGGWD